MTTLTPTRPRTENKLKYSSFSISRSHVSAFGHTRGSAGHTSKPKAHYATGLRV